MHVFDLFLLEEDNSMSSEDFDCIHMVGLQEAAQCQCHRHQYIKYP